MIIDELEVLTGKTIRGDITPIVFELLKDSKYIDDFIKEYSKFLEEEKREYVCEQKCDTDTSEESSNGVNIEEWLSNNGKPVAL